MGKVKNEDLRLNIIVSRTKTVNYTTYCLEKKKQPAVNQPAVILSSGGRTRTSGLRVMSPTSYQLLYPAMFWFCKDTHYFF